ncbi:MAG: hypothetical protein AAB706_02925 [Patescibacteria group bacterium]
MDNNPIQETGLKIIHCIPIAKGIFKEHLSYFTNSDIPLGAIIKVPVRNRKISALVIRKENALELKADIKRAAFAIKKIESVEAFSLFAPEFIESAEEAAEYFATTTGQVVSSFIPKNIIENAGSLARPPLIGKTLVKGERFIIQTDTPERFANYKSLIREEFARHSSVFFCLPTVEDIKKARDTLEKGIEAYTFFIHGGMSKNDVLETWDKIVTEPHPVLIIATGMFFSIPRGDISTIIIERESSRSYKTQKRPLIDIRTFAEIFARKSGKRLILGDTLLRVETLFHYKNGEYLELIPPKFRSLLHADTHIVSMKNKAGSKGKFEIIGSELKTLIEETKQNNERLFLFAARKGLAPSIVCEDCGHTVVSKQCGAPMMLYRAERENFFFCPVCKEERNAKETCRYCGSWRLKALGIGIERVEEEIKELFPTIKLFRLDKDKARTYKQARDIAEKFENTPSSILLGTEMALLYLSNIENAAVVSMDSLFSIADFRINEKILYILLTMRSNVQKKLLIQTRNPDQLILDYAIKGNLIDFYRDEVTIREKLRYPPFSIIIKIAIRGRKNTVENLMEKLKGEFQEYMGDIFPTIAGPTEKAYGLNLVMKIPRDKWVDRNLVQKLRSLPPSVLVEVDPESLLN